MTAPAAVSKTASTESPAVFDDVTRDGTRPRRKTPARLERLQRRALVRFHQPRIADGVGGEDRREPLPDDRVSPIGRGLPA